MRPRYETYADLSNESEIIDDACVAWQCQAIKLPNSYRLDFALLRDEKVVAFAEVKRRNVLHNAYPTAFISLSKVMTARLMRPLPSFWIVAWDDGIGYVRLDNHNGEITMAGRRDRHDPADIEPMAHFKTELFTKL